MSKGAYGLAFAHDNEDAPETGTLIYAPTEVYAPTDAQANICGNTTNEGGSDLNPAFGNTCVNEDTSSSDVESTTSDEDEDED